MISEGQRLQYLEAMGIQPWISREQASAQNQRPLVALDQPESGNPATVPAVTGARQVNQVPDRLASFEIGPGSGSILLLCTRPEDSATPLASDIARCLDEAPVWGWLPQEDSGFAETALSLERVIDERLFTRVLIFCADSNAGQAGKVEVVSSARIIHAPPMTELADHPAHKRRLWTQLLKHGWCARQG